MPDGNICPDSGIYDPDSYRNPHDKNSDREFSGEFNKDFYSGYDREFNEKDNDFYEGFDREFNEKGNDFYEGAEPNLYDLEPSESGRYENIVLTYDSIHFRSLKLTPCKGGSFQDASQPSSPNQNTSNQSPFQPNPNTAHQSTPQTDEFIRHPNFVVHSAPPIPHPYDISTSNNNQQTIPIARNQPIGFSNVPPHEVWPS